MEEAQERTSDNYNGPYCLLCQYSLRELTESRCPECGRAFDLNDPKSFRKELLSKNAAYWLSPPGTRSKWIAIALASIALASNAFPEGFFVLFIPVILGWLICCCWWLTRLIIWAIGHLMHGFVHQPGRNAIRWLITPGILATMIGCLALNVPLYMTFFVSLPFMNRTAAQVLTPAKPPLSISWIGVYPVERVEAFQGGMRFLVAGTGFMDSGGFAYSPNGPPPRIGEDYYHHLWGGRYQWRESF